ncbi:carbohydrate porin [Acidobacteria bacterium AB60]|nr:carbohydrate porin [Acidobacteria bacterium AB60]
MNTQCKQIRMALAIVMIALGCTSSTAQEQRTPEGTSNPAASIESLNIPGGDAALPPLSDSAIDVNSPFRQVLWHRGLALRLVNTTRYAQNTLQAPVPADQQVYVGQHPFQGEVINPILTWDLRQLGLRHAQFDVSGAWQWVSWEPAGPKAFGLWTLYLYKEFGHDRVEVKTGYDSNDIEFVGMQVGGSTAGGVQGVYAVLPYEVGMAFFPLTAPQLNLKLNAPGRTYLKLGFQRSLDAEGGPATEARNHTGVRFDPKGDKLLSIGEAGFRRPATSSERAIWFRAGYLHNTTRYLNFASGRYEPGNHVAFALIDDQLTRSGVEHHPERGIYIGASAMTAASDFNAYDRYYEARLYKLGPFTSRPLDVASLVSTYTGFSKSLTDSLVANGASVWRNSASATGSYNFHLAPGNYLSVGLSYVHGPAVKPKADDALTFAAVYSVFF